MVGVTLPSSWKANAMVKALELTDEERDQFEQGIENFLEFTRDVQNDPTILDHIPDGSNVKAIPKEQRDPAEHYDIETPRMVAKVTPPSQTPQGR